MAVKGTVWRRIEVGEQAAGVAVENGRLLVDGFDLEAERAAANLADQAPNVLVALLFVLEREVAAGKDLDTVLAGYRKAMANPADKGSLTRSPLAIAALTYLPSGDDPDDLLRDMVHLRNTPPEALAVMLESKVWGVAGPVARHPNLTPELRRRILTHREGVVRSTFASRPDLSPEEARVLLLDSSDDVLTGLAANPLTAPDLLEMLSESDVVKIREGVARNSKTPDHLVEKLRHDSHHRVRRSIALRAGLSAEAYEDLMKGSAIVRRRLAGNPNTPVQVLKKLFETDKDSEVLRRLARNPSMPLALLGKMASHATKRARGSAAMSPRTDPRTLEVLADDPEANVRTQVAANPNTPVSTLIKLASDGEYWVRASVAANRSAPPGLLAKLSHDRSHEVRRDVARNVNTPPGDLLGLCEDEEYGVRKFAEETLAKLPKRVREASGLGL